MKEQEFDPRDFYDYEKEESGKTDAEIDAIVGEIYRSVVGGTLPGQTAAGSRDRTRQAAADAPQRRPTSRERKKPARKKKPHRLRTALCLLLCVAGLYGIAIYGNIPFMKPPSIV